MMRLPSSSLLFGLLTLSITACGAAPNADGTDGKDSTDHVDTTSSTTLDAGVQTGVGTPGPVYGGEVDAGFPWCDDAGTGPGYPEDAGVGEPLDAGAPFEGDGGICEVDDAGIGGDDTDAGPSAGCGRGHGGHGGHDLDAGPPTGDDAGF